MATKIRKCTSEKKVIRFKRKKRIRGHLSGTLTRPRLAVFRSNSNIYAQIIDDERGVTIVAASTCEKDNKNAGKSNIAGAQLVGKLIAERALAKQIKAVVFDRSGYLYHGKIKGLADSAREAGLLF